MQTYGFRIQVNRDGGNGWGVLRREFEAADARAARTMIDGWAAVEGVKLGEVELIADGCTFREEGKRRAMRMAGELSLSHGVAVEGPWDNPGCPVLVRLVKADGSGVSLATDGANHYDPAPALEALRFDSAGEFTGHPQRDVTAEVVAEMLSGN